MKKVKTFKYQHIKEHDREKADVGNVQTCCQSACKTSCTVGNQSCENSDR